MEDGLCGKRERQNNAKNKKVQACEQIHSSSWTVLSARNLRNVANLTFSLETYTKAVDAVQNATTVATMNFMFVE